MLLDILQHFELLCLTVKLVAVRTDLTEVSKILLSQREIFLRNFRADSLLVHLELLVGQVSNHFLHGNQEFVDGVDDVLATTLRALDHELAPDDFAGINSARKHDIAKLLLSPEIVEERL